MAHKILNTPGGIGQIPAGNVLVGNGYTDNLATFNGKIFVFDFDNQPDPYNPLNLPKNTIRVKFKSGYTPDMGDTQTLVDDTNNVWDIYKEGTDWDGLFNENSDHYLLEVLGANTKNVTTMFSLFHYCKALTRVTLFDTSNVTSMNQMFYCCESLTNVPLYDTSKVTDMARMFYMCHSLTSVPLIDTSSVTDMDSMLYDCTSLTNLPLFDTSSVTNMDGTFTDCINVKSGALALYQQASTQTNPPSQHSFTFYGCGSNTQTGAAELAQIPSGPDGWR